MWGDIFPPAGNRDFTERDMVKVAALHAQSQAEIVALQAQVDALREFAQHDMGCQTWQGHACDCGLLELLR